MSLGITLAAISAAVVVVSVLGGLLPLALMLNHTRLQVYLSFSAGTMLGAAFFHMLPEAVRLGSPGTVYWAAPGLLALFFLERFFSFHRHESHEPHAPGAAPHDGGHHGPHPDHEHGPCEPSPHSSRALRWGSAAIGLAVHSLVGGVALASAVAADYEVGQRLLGAGLGVFVATLVHKPADALTITSLMLESGVERRYAHAINLAFALMIPVGVVLFAAGSGVFLPAAPGAPTAAALAFSAGTFLCIALSDVLPELHFHAHDRLKLSAALLAGVGLMAATALIEPPASDHDGEDRAAPAADKSRQPARALLRRLPLDLRPAHAAARSPDDLDDPNRDRFDSKKRT
ncbi:MAG: ZIP family metal transporter [Isosphaeraceae bacterium]